jgi:hypothetical protein
MYRWLGLLNLMYLGAAVIVRATRSADKAAEPGDSGGSNR